MLIQIHSRSFKLTRALKEYANAKLQAALDKSQDKFTKVIIRLSDINGPKGGVDKHCQVHVMLSGLPDVIISHKNADMYQAIDRAVERAEVAVKRRIDRKLSMQKLGIPMAQHFVA